MVPLLGVLSYLIVHGGDMQQRTRDETRAMERAQRDYIMSVSGHQSTADELVRLAELRNRGVINDAEFDSQKASLLR